MNIKEKPKEMLVSISCLTYNHEAHIRRCLDSFLMQKTDFRFEILIHDDASTDSTQDIIREYEEKYPDILKPIYQTDNQFKKKIGISRTFQFPRARGKYIALCEGDDYWTDPLKLQKQVDFLEENNDYSMCIHNAYIVNNKTKEKKLFNEKKIKSTITTRDVILRPWFSPTASFLFRKEKYPLSIFWKDVSGDMQILLINSTLGKIHYMEEPMSVYNLFSSNTSLSIKLDYKNMYQRKIRLMNEFDKFTLNRYKIYTMLKRMGIYIRIIQKRLSKF